MLASMDNWLQVRTGEGGYVPVPPRAVRKPKPNWEELLYPCTTFDEVLQLACQGTIVNVIDHPVITGLREA